ncbi:MAG: TatD family hydrolase [Phycisphaerae bacterium]|nr:TatD family hydrolase [Phycisphaerae bacterium]
MSDTPPLIDTHCHLAHGRLRPQVEAVLARAREAGVVAMVCAAGNVTDSKAALGLARAHGDVCALAGIHPHDAAEAPDDFLDRLERLAAGERNVAIGEIGLDYHYDFSPRDAQREVFAAQLALAGRLSKRVVIHTREAFDDTLAILDESDVDGADVVFHSFTGGVEETRRVLDCGAMVSYSGIVTFKKADTLRAAAATVPDDRLLIETDAPYLSPEPVRKHKTNEPANVAHVAARLAEVRGVSVGALAERTSANAAGFFGL